MRPWRDILGWYGTSGPIPPKSTLRQDQAPLGDPWSPATVYGDRPQLSGVKPADLIRILREADDNNLVDYLKAVSELEERDPQYGAVMSTRRTAVRALEYELVRPKGSKARPYRGAKAWVDGGALDGAIDLLVESFGPGYAAVEMIWSISETTGMLEPAFEERDPRQFCFDKTGRNLLINNGFAKEELEPYKWACHFPRCRPGPPFKAGLGRPALYYNMLKTLSLSGLIRLQSIYGVPQAVVTYTNRASAAQIEQIRQSLQVLGTGAGIAIPDLATIDIKQAGNGGTTTADLFMQPLKYIDQQLSKLVLGQTMTTDSGGSYAQASVHNEVRRDIREADAERLGRTLTEVVRYFIDLNYGVQAVYPTIRFIIPESMTPAEVVAAAQGLVGLGLPVDTDELYARVGFTKPTEAPEIVGPQAS